MRINVINPFFLTDNHLIAEYREIKMITYYYVKSLKSKNGMDRSKISKRYTLNKGHAYMWFDKLGYVDRRFKSIVEEMKRRGFKTNFTVLNYTDIPETAFGNFIPDDEDIRVNLDRVLIRIADKPLWYKYMGSNISNWDEWYETNFREGNLLGLNPMV